MKSLVLNATIKKWCL